ncbi:MAG TPA: hypothetical protein VFC73_09140 [Syntrophomonadaceae bacterium]|nr:hypothetical protein [Syntrophomonadaceae bacterium]
MGNNEEINMERLITTDEIKNMEITKGSTGEIKNLTLNDTFEISDLIKMIKKIPIQRLNESEDMEFMPSRIEDNAMINVHFFSDEKSWAGNFSIWPDGAIYIVDIDTMLSNKRTISYLSRSKYPQIYELLDNLVD